MNRPDPCLQDRLLSPSSNYDPTFSHTSKESLNKIFPHHSNRYNRNTESRNREKSFLTKMNIFVIVSFIAIIAFLGGIAIYVFIIQNNPPDIPTDVADSNRLQSPLLMSNIPMNQLQSSDDDEPDLLFLEQEKKLRWQIVSQLLRD